MSKTKSAFSKTKTKIITGYLLFAIILISATIYTTLDVKKLLDETDINERQVEKRACINSTLTHLFNAESHIGPMIIDTNDFYAYKLEAQKINNDLEHLINFCSATHKNQIDSIKALMTDKEKTLVELMRLTNQNELEDIYNKNLLGIIDENNELKEYEKIVSTKTVRQDTIIEHKKRKRMNFFRRFFLLFSKEEPDTTLLTYSSEEILHDTLIHHYNPTDTLLAFMNEIKFALIEEKKEIDKELTQNVINLRSKNNSITLSIKQILKNIEVEGEKEYEDMLQQREARFKQLTKKLIIAIFVAVILIIIFTYIISNDITKSKKYRRELEMSNKDMQKLLHDKEKLMLSISHDMKAPLGSTIGYIELMNSTSLNERQRYYLQNMQKSSEEILQLINNILENEQLTKGIFELNKIPFSIQELLDDIHNSFIPIAAKKGLTFTYLCQLEIDHKYMGDPLRIKQIIHNLLSNAIKFTDKGEITLKAEQRNKNSDIEQIRFIVKDTGYGIPESSQNQIFEEFSRIKNAGKENIEGVGLGLSIVKKLVELLNGEISLKSKKDEGTEFTIVLPLERQKHKEKKADGKIDDKRILVVDDDDTQLLLISEILKNTGAKTYTATRVQTALELIETEEFDIIFTDIQMPDINGFDFVKQIRNSSVKNARKIPIIALSARADLTEEDMKKRGFTSFLTKPYSANKLIQTLNTYLNYNIKSINKDFHNNHYENLLSFACGDKDAEIEILKSFIEETKKGVDELKEKGDNNDIERCKAIAHKLRPLFLSIEEVSIGQTLGKLENLDVWTKNEIQDLQRTINEAEKSIQAVEEYLSRLLQID